MCRRGRSFHGRPLPYAFLPPLSTPLVTRPLLRCLLQAGSLIVFVAAAGDAQLRVDAELGGARVSQANFPALEALTVQGTADYQRRWFTVLGASVITLPTTQPTRLHALLGGSVHAPLDRRFAAEVGAHGSTYDDGVFPVMRAGYLTARLHARGDRAIAWLGARHGALDDQFYRYPLTTGDLGVLARWSGLQVAGTATYHRTESEPYLVLNETADTAMTVRDRITYTDVVLTPRREWGRLELGARGGVRFVHSTVAFEPRERQAYGSVDAAWWASPRVAVVAAFGRELADLARGLPDARYLSVGVRARLQGAPRVLPARTAPRSVVAGSAPDILIENGSSDGTVLRVLAGAGARRVEVAGTFNEWEPMVLEADGSGGWRLPLDLASGTHRLMVRVDGGAWMAPANLPSLDDPELGGRVGLITVP